MRRMEGRQRREGQLRVGGVELTGLGAAVVSVLWSVVAALRLAPVTKRLDRELSPTTKPPVTKPSFRSHKSRMRAPCGTGIICTTREVDVVTPVFPKS